MTEVPPQQGDFTVPVIDVARWAEGGASVRAALASAVDAAARTVGFMQITGHGIPAAAGRDLADAMDAFFAPPGRRRAPWSPRPRSTGATPRPVRRNSASAWA